MPSLPGIQEQSAAGSPAMGHLCHLLAALSPVWGCQGTCDTPAAASSTWGRALLPALLPKPRGRVEVKQTLLQWGFSAPPWLVVSAGLDLPRLAFGVLGSFPAAWGMLWQGGGGHGAGSGPTES